MNNQQHVSNYRCKFRSLGLVIAGTLLTALLLLYLGSVTQLILFEYLLAFTFVPMYHIAYRFQNRLCYTLIGLSAYFILFFFIHLSLIVSENAYYLLIFYTILSFLISENIFQRNKSFLALSQSEERFRALTENTGDVIILFDNDRICTYVNPSMTKICLYGKEEILGKPISAMIHESDRESFEQSITESIQFPQKTLAITHLRFRHKNETWLHIEGSLTCLFEKQGINGIVFTFRNVTERFHAEALQQIIKDLSLALSQTSNFDTAMIRLLEFAMTIKGIDCGGVYMVNHDNKSVDLVASLGIPEWIVQQVSRYTHNSLEFQTVMKGTSFYWHAPNPFPLPQNAIQYDKIRALAVIPVYYKNRIVATLNLGSHIEGEIPQNTRHTLETIASQIGGVISRVHTEKAFRESQQKLQTLFDSIEDFVFILDTEGTILHTNPIVEKRLGYTNQELHGSSILRMHHPDQREQVAETILDLLTGKISSYSYPLMSKEGMIIPAETRVSRGSWDGHSAIFGISRDMTENKRLENQLLYAQKMEVTGQFAAGVAHNINNLLTGIIGNLCLATQKSNDDTKKYLNKIDKAANRASDLVRQLLAFSHKTNVEFQSVDLNEIVEEVYSFIQETFDRRITIVKNIKENLPRILASESQINSILVNLCLNARDAIHAIFEKNQWEERKKDSFTITISTHFETISSQKNTVHHSMPADDYIVFRVSDNGIGMTPTTRKHLFEPFYTTKETVGTGLGLASVFGIVKQHNGWIDFTSEYGKGSTFTIYLPAHDHAINQIPQLRKHQVQKRGTETIIVAESEEMHLQEMKKLLHKNGYEVLIAHDGIETLEIYQSGNRPIDLMILDRSLPKISGIEVMKKIRMMDPHIKIMISTDDPLQNRVEVHQQENHLEFIQKPYHPPALLRNIRRLLDLPHAMNQSV